MTARWIVKDGSRVLTIELDPGRGATRLSKLKHLVDVEGRENYRNMEALLWILLLALGWHRDSPRSLQLQSDWHTYLSHRPHVTVFWDCGSLTSGSYARGLCQGQDKPVPRRVGSAIGEASGKEFARALGSQEPVPCATASREER